MADKPFHFKHFSMMHSHSTMRIGTDAVLLGRWVDVSPADTVLDVGTGCGIIAMMLAQRGAAHVDAVELDDDSASEAALNFKVSQWRDKMCAYNADTKSFDNGTRYDVIVSNPPYFVNSSKCDEDRRSMARHSGMTLSFEDLLSAAKRLLKDDGRFSVVLPQREETNFIKEASRFGFCLKRKLDIIPVEGLPYNRVNLEFVRDRAKMDCVKESFVIRYADGTFTDEYNTFLKDFYLGL